jgi:hypothetical protein
MAVEIRFDANQQYQRDAIDAVVELFAGQEAIDQGLGTPTLAEDGTLFEELVFGNSLGPTASNELVLNGNAVKSTDSLVLLRSGSASVPANSRGLQSFQNAPTP